tara:strand:+ start:491 stop:1954 length:1464 start_codon:yes stop_codon:yes gene_type:complete
MSIKNYLAGDDNTITDAYRPESASRRMSNLNFGLTENLEIYSLYNTVTASADDNGKARILIQFNTAQMLVDRNLGDLPASGSVSFHLQMKNYPHSSTTPTSSTVQISPLSRSWEEGRGASFDNMDNKIGSNWLTASSKPHVAWTTDGGDVRESPISKYTFDTGVEDLSINITTYVESILTDSVTDYGLLLQLTASQESASQSHYKKGFYSAQYSDFHKRPLIQARFNDSLQDNGGNLYLSASRSTADDNLNTIYLYNYIKGNLVNIPSIATGDLYVSIYSGSSETTTSGSKLSLPVGGGVVSGSDTNITGSYVSAGIYSASFAFNSSSLENIFAVWHDNTTEFHTSSVLNPVSRPFPSHRKTNKYYLSLTNLKDTYLNTHTSRLRLFVRDPSIAPTVQTTAITTMQATQIEKAYYRVIRKRDKLEIIPYGTGSSNEEFTLLSYDSKGNYFDLDFANFDVNTVYSLSFMFYENGQYREQSQKFDFRVV